MADKAPQKLFVCLYMRAEGNKSQKKSNKNHKYWKGFVRNIFGHSTGDEVFGGSLSDKNNEEIDFEFEQNKQTV